MARRRNKGIKKKIAKTFEEAMKKLNVDSVQMSTGGYKDGNWKCAWMVDLPFPSDFDTSIRAGGEAEIKEYVEMKNLEIETILRDCFGNIEPTAYRYNFTFHMPPMHVAIPEQWDHVNGEFQKVKDARLLTDAEMDERLDFFVKEGESNHYFAMDAKMLQWERENWSSFFRFVGGSPFTDELFEGTHYAGLRMFGDFTFEAFGAFLLPSDVSDKVSGL